jgi:hypothetical protein
MTVLGKILVFVNLVFSLLTGALIIMVFVTRTNWRTEFESLNKKYGVQRTTIEAYAQDLDSMTKKKEEKEAELTALRTSTTEAEKGLNAKLAALDTISKQNEARAKAAEASLDAAVAEKGRRQQEVEALKAVNADKEKKLGDLEVAIKDFRDRAVGAEISYKAALERNGLLLAQLEKVDRENQDLRNTQAPGGAGRGLVAGSQPPAEDLKGSVLAVDAKSGLLTVSLGTDSGLKVGNTLQVYHLEPKPEYLGTIRIVDANFKYAVARPVAPLQAIQLVKGDTVASRISGR